MDVNSISIGKNPPEDVNVIIEVPQGISHVKYELEKDGGVLYVDRLLHTAMYYPCNYGFIPHTLSGDGDPTDVLVVTSEPLVPCSVIAVRPIGVLLMEDESGEDEKILAVPLTKIDPTYADINSYEDLPASLRQKISHFFERYKDLEPNKWVKVTGFEGVEKAKSLITDGIKRAEDKAA